MPSKTPKALLNRLDWTVTRRLHGLYQGEYQTLFRGDGVDLADLREYQPTDDVRRIDWNVTARLQTPYVRIFEEDRELTAWFLVDLSSSLNVGWSETRKRDVALEFTTLLARVLSQRGNRVGAVLFGHGRHEVHPPGSGEPHLLALVRRMMRAEPSNTTRTNLAETFRAAGNVIRRRGLVFVVSDFVSEPGWEKELGRLAVRNEVVACRVVDPMEREIENVGMLVMQDAETGEQLFLDTGQPGIRRAYRKAAAAEDERIAAGLSDSLVDCVEVSTSDALLDTLLRFSEIRKSRARAAVPQEA